MALLIHAIFDASFLTYVFVCVLVCRAGALTDTHRCCALLVAELLKRCTHKDMTAEYRIVAAALQVEQPRRALFIYPRIDC